MRNFVLPSVWVLLSTFLFFLFCIIFLKKKKKDHKPSLKLLPGPSKLPIIGSLHHLFGDEPHLRLHELSTKHGPVMHLQLGQTSTIVVSSSTMAREFLHTHDITFASKPQRLSSRILLYDCTDIFFSPYGNYWKKLRTICLLELLSPKRVRSFARVREEEVANMIKSISNSSSEKPAGTSVDLSELLYSLSNNIICRAMMGENCKHKERLLEYMRELLVHISGFKYFDMLRYLEFTTFFTGMRWKLENLHKKIDVILDEIISERMQKKLNDGRSGVVEEEEEDLLDVLLRLHADDSNCDFSFSLDSMKAVILDMFLGGTDTTATSLEWAMSELITNPHAIKKAQDEVRSVVGSFQSMVDESTISELNYMNLIIKETLRLHPTAPFIPRESRDSCNVDGYDIPIKTLLLVSVWSIGRDPKLWENPDRFEPERFLGSPIRFKGSNFELLPFGSGRRICPGMGFGMAIVELALAELLRRFDWELPSGISREEFDMTDRYASTLKKKTPLVLVATPVSF